MKIGDGGKWSENSDWRVTLTPLRHIVLNQKDDFEKKKGSSVQSQKRARRKYIIHVGFELSKYSSSSENRQRGSENQNQILILALLDTWGAENLKSPCLSYSLLKSGSLDQCGVCNIYQPHWLCLQVCVRIVDMMEPGAAIVKDIKKKGMRLLLTRWTGSSEACW